jgi:SHS2 domain-containing protein
MTKHCEPFEHPADVGLAARADTLAELYEALAEGLADLICPRATVRPATSRAIEVRAEDAESLAVDFLAAVLSAIQEDRFLVAAVSAEVVPPEGTRAPPAPDSPSAPAAAGAPEQPAAVEVRAVLRGETYDPARHELRIEVKAVTYHQLEVARREGAWHGRVVLDL